MNLGSQISCRPQSKAVALFQPDETETGFSPGRYKRFASRPAGALALHLTISSLERVVRSLLPFYGANCPIAIYDDAEPESLIARATLGAIDGWEPPHESLLLVIG